MEITLSNIWKFNSQQVFDKVALHMLTQRKKALDGRGLCMYRTEDGLKCAVGCLISDEEYAPKWEGSSVWNIISDYKEVGNHYLLLESLQSVHDVGEVSEWKNRLIQLADKYELDPSVVTNFNREE